MAVTNEYIIILTGRLTYLNLQVVRINITKDHFILCDKSSIEIFRSRRLGDSVKIVSDMIRGLSIGGCLTFIPANRILLAGDAGVTIECELLNIDV